MVAIAFPVSSAPGASRGEGQGRLLNAYAEKLQAGGASASVIRRVPGLRRAVDTETLGICRGMITVAGVTLACIDDRLIKIELSGSTYTATDLGELPGEGLVTMAANNASPTPDVAATTSVGNYIIDLTTGPADYPDADLPQANSVTFLDGYFLFSIADGRIFASALNDTAVNPLDFTTCQARPGGLYRVVSFGQQLYAFGPSSVEVFANTANEEGFPFSRVAVIPTGLLAPSAIAGFEDGWGAALIWVGDDRAVYRLDSGYGPQRVSPPDLDRALQAVGSTADLHALVYEHPGHSCWSISGPLFTWVYDLTSGWWHERESYLQSNWSARCSVRFEGQWIVGHASNGCVYVVDDEWRREDSGPLVMTIRSGQNTGFPNSVVSPRLELQVVVGQGDDAGEQPIETDPRCTIRYSKDGGNTFSLPVVRSLGKQGAYSTRVTVNRLGMARNKGFVFEIEVSDPVYFALLGGDIEADARPR